MVHSRALVEVHFIFGDLMKNGFLAFFWGRDWADLGDFWSFLKNRPKATVQSWRAATIFIFWLFRGDIAPTEIFSIAEDYGLLPPLGV